MAYRELGVIEIREVLRRFCRGESVRAIARVTRSDRKTVAKYVAVAGAIGLESGAAARREAENRRRPSGWGNGFEKPRVKAFGKGHVRYARGTFPKEDGLPAGG